jgi:hypothetical protein
MYNPEVELEVFVWNINGDADFAYFWFEGLEIDLSRTYLQIPLRQWGAGNVYLLVLSSWKVTIAVMGL